MTVTLDDVSCQMHLYIEGHLLDHDLSLTKSEVVDLMVRLLASDLGGGWVPDEKNEGCLCTFSVGWGRIWRNVLRKQLKLGRIVMLRRWNWSRTKLSASICSIWWVSRSSLTRASTMSTWHTWSTSVTWSWSPIIHEERLPLLTYTQSLIVDVIIKSS